MSRLGAATVGARRLGGPLSFALAWLCGCAVSRPAALSELELRDLIERYAASRAEREAARPRRRRGARPAAGGPAAGYPALGMFPAGQGVRSRPASRPAGIPADYWRPGLGDQAGVEFRQFAGRELWRGFKTSFWDLDNALALTAAMGASIAIRETGVDGTIRGRVAGHRQLGDMDETIQILGNPGTHFAASGMLWLASAWARDVREHEVARALTEALAVNGLTTLALKAAANTRSPNGARYAWPSGHTSSSFTVAAVLNEHYGPWAGIPCLALAGLVGYQRVDSREHELSDVVFGAVLGYVVGSAIARDRKRELPEVFGMKLVPFSDPQRGAAGLALLKQF